MARFNVVMTAPRLAAPAVALLEDAGCAIHYMAAYPPPSDIAALVASVQADAVLTRQGRVDDAVLAASPKLVVVARHGVGVDDVDLVAAERRGVMVTRAPGSNTRAVAEHTLAFIFALAKDFRSLGQAIAAGGWRGGAVRDVAGMRLGLVGLGAIGRDVAGLARVLGMEVAAFDPAAGSGEAVPLFADLPALLARSDVVSLHCPYSPRTHHLIDAAALAAMPAGGFVVNTARGGLIDEAALLGALESGHLAGAALDVFETEPPDLADALRNHPRVLVTPHVAGVTASSLVNMGVMAAECIVAKLSGGTVPPDRIVRSG
jgi:D-3-phosphoglycerate dehydrogenase